MKVDGKNPNLIQDIKSGKSKDIDLKKSNKDAIQTNDSVKTSSFAMDKMKLRISAEPEIRSDLVKEIKGKIKNGEYEIEPKKIASKILTESLTDEIK